MIGVAAGVGALSAATLVFGLAAAGPPDRMTAVVVHTLMVAVPGAVAVGVLRRRPGDRFAVLLLVATALLAMTALSLSDDSLPHSVGRVSVWVVEPLIVYLLLAFPFGRLAGRAERVVFQVAVAIAAVLYVAPMLLTAASPSRPRTTRAVRPAPATPSCSPGRSRRSSRTSCDPCARCSRRWCSSPSPGCSCVACAARRRWAAASSPRSW